MTLDPAAYLTEVLDYIQCSALKSKGLDWTAIRTEALTRIQDAQTTAETYPTLRWVLSRLGDHHSFLAVPRDVQHLQAGSTTSLGLLAVHPEGVIVEVQPNSPAARAGLQLRDTIATINGKPIAQFDHTTLQRALHAPSASLAVRRAVQASLFSVTLHAASYQREMQPHGRLLDAGMGYLDLPGIAGRSAILKAYVGAAQRLIRDLDRLGTRQWVLDLRRNVGGNMWSMLAGVMPLLGAGECGFFVSSEGRQTSWLPTLQTTQTRAYFGKSYRLKHPIAAVAVLTSRLTCSSGEFITVASASPKLRRSNGRAPNSYSGQNTAGWRTVVSDGVARC